MDNKNSYKYLKYGGAESTSPSLDTYRDKYLKYDDPSLDRDFKSLYLKYKTKYLNLKVNQRGGSEKPILNLFKSEHCGHCIAFKPTWETINKNLSDKVNFKVYDAESDREIMSKYAIEGFPTIILQKGDKVVEFIGDRSIQNIERFVDEYSKQL